MIKPVYKKKQFYPNHASHLTNHNKNILRKELSKNTSTCNCQNKEAFLLHGQCQIGLVVFEVLRSSNQPIYKGKSILELRENLSKDVDITTNYFSELNFAKTTPNILRNSGKSR